MYKPTSKVQSLAGEAIRFWFPNEEVAENHRPYWLFGMELDFYIHKFKIGFEIQGEQHRRYVQKFHRNMEDFKQQVARDERKRELCKSQGVALVEVFSLMELTQKVRACVLWRRIENLPAGLYWRMKEYDEAHQFIQDNPWAAKDPNKTKRKK